MGCCCTSLYYESVKYNHRFQGRGRQYTSEWTGNVVPPRKYSNVKSLKYRVENEHPDFRNELVNLEKIRFQPMKINSVNKNIPEWVTEIDFYGQRSMGAFQTVFEDFVNYPYTETNKLKRMSICSSQISDRFFRFPGHIEELVIYGYPKMTEEENMLQLDLLPPVTKLVVATCHSVTFSQLRPVELHFDRIPYSVRTLQIILYNNNKYDIYLDNLPPLVEQVFINSDIIYDTRLHFVPFCNLKLIVLNRTIIYSTGIMREEINNLIGRNVPMLFENGVRTIELSEIMRSQSYEYSTNSRVFCPNPFNEITCSLITFIISLILSIYLVFFVSFKTPLYCSQYTDLTDSCHVAVEYGYYNETNNVYCSDITCSNNNTCPVPNDIDTGYNNGEIPNKFVYWDFSTCEHIKMGTFVGYALLLAVGLIGFMCFGCITVSTFYENPVFFKSTHEIVKLFKHFDETSSRNVLRVITDEPPQRIKRDFMRCNPYINLGEMFYDNQRDNFPRHRNVMQPGDPDVRYREGFRRFYQFVI